MAYRANATDFKPEFGVMYDPSIDDRIKELDEEGLRKLVLFKQARKLGQKPCRDNYVDACGYEGIGADRLFGRG